MRMKLSSIIEATPLALSLRVKMALMVSVLIVTMVSAIATLTIVSLEHRIKDDVSSQQFTLVSSLANSVDDKLVMAQEALLAVVGDLPSPEINNADAVQAFLDKKKVLHTLFDNGLFVFSREGTLIAESPFLPGRRGLNFAFRGYFQQTITTGKPVISAPFRSSKPQNDPSIMLTAPLKDKSGNIVAVLGGSLNLLQANFLGQIPLIRIGSSGYLYLYDTDRMMILHPDRKRMLKQDVPVGANRLFDLAIAGFEGSGETVNSRGIKSLASFKRLKSTSWILAANYPVAEAYAAAILARKTLLLNLLPLTVLILLATLYFMNRLFHPLRLFTDHIRSLPGKEGQERQFPVTGSDEIGTLAQVFNDFAAGQERQQEQLREARDRSEEERSKTEAIIAAIGESLTIQDTEFRILYQNQRSREMLGDLVGTFCYRSIHGLEHPCAICALTETYCDGRVHRLENSAMTGGKRTHYEMTSSAIFGADGRIVGGIEMVRDITDRKLGEERLKKSGQLLAEAQQIARLGIFERNIVNNEIIWSAEMYSIFGLNQLDGPITAERVLEAIVPDERDRFESTIRSALYDSKIFDLEYTILRPDGALRIIAAHGQVADDEAGQPLRLVGVCQDITERRQAEESLRILSQAVVQSPTAIVITDPSGTIEYVNPRFTELTGYSAEEAVGRNPRIISSGHTPAEVYRELWETILAGDKWQGELYNRKKNGELYWERAMIAPIFGGDGEIAHFIAIKEDISDQRALENQLRHSQKMEAIGRLSAGIAHDFNNILTVVIGYASLQMMISEEGSPLKLDMENIVTTANRGVSLTKDLLAFSRKQPLNPEPVDLNSVVTTVSDLLQRLIGKGIELKIALSPVALPVLANSNNLVQVLMNLATNARDAMPDGGVLRLSAESVLLGNELKSRYGYGASGTYALLSISDTGCGMDDATVNRVFEPFFTTKELGKGTGLGLSISYGIIKQHKGYIMCNSKPGVGTTFQIYIPLQESTE
ncbi:MAG: PAS domain S-box protein [Desulfobacteraceae bacterium]|nr:PAS domain S-box protein [Desulfobacteraceae bacterium]